MHAAAAERRNHEVTGGETQDGLCVVVSAGDHLWPPRTDGEDSWMAAGCDGLNTKIIHVREHWVLTRQNGEEIP